jgi:8-amino-7-oxononanoate synthase
VFGERGSGLVEQLNLGERVHVRMGTLSKALGSAGGFVAGSRPLVDWLTNRARSYVFSTAHPAAACAAAVAALDIVRDEPWRRNELLSRAAALRARLTADGWNVGAAASQIIPLIVGDPDRTMRLAAALRERGYWVPGIRPPSVPAGESLLRVSISYGHSAQQLTALAEVLAQLRPTMS